MSICPKINTRLPDQVPDSLHPMQAKLKNNSKACAERLFLTSSSIQLVQYALKHYSLETWQLYKDNRSYQKTQCTVVHAAFHGSQSETQKSTHPNFYSNPAAEAGQAAWMAAKGASCKANPAINCVVPSARLFSRFWSRRSSAIYLLRLECTGPFGIQKHLTRLEGR